MRPLVVGNWKMNTSLADASVLATMVRNQLHEVTGVDVVICPPHIWLQEVASILEISAPHIFLGAQDCYPEDSGPYTGEVSVAMLKDFCSFVIVGHSERREHFNESSEFVSDKVQAVLRHGMTPILCVGEQHKGDGNTEQIMAELRDSLAGIEPEEYPKIAVAYEPVWSISTVTTGEIATGEYANGICQRIKKFVGAETRVLYGGSVAANNIDDFARQPHIDGVLMGGASLKGADFVEVCRQARG